MHNVRVSWLKERSLQGVRNMGLSLEKEVVEGYKRKRAAEVSAGMEVDEGLGGRV